MIETAADRAALVSDEDFGTLGTYQVTGGGASALLAGIFDRPTLEISLGDAASIDAKPTFYCASADIPPAAAGEGDTLQIGDTLYKVFALKPDGTGMTRIHLGK